MSKLGVEKPQKVRTIPPSMDTPAFQKPNNGEELFHFSHPQHPLVQINMPYLFTCMGCKEYGAGRRFRCQICGFDLHDFCALAPQYLRNHPFHHKHQLVFYVKPGKVSSYMNACLVEIHWEEMLLHFLRYFFKIVPRPCLTRLEPLFIKHIGGFLHSKCDICGKSAKGYAFRCTSCSFEMHPCCAAMSREMEFLTHQHPLTLSSAVANAGGESSCICQMCRRKRSGQFYQCGTCGYCLHAICAKDLVNGLYVHGIMPPEKNNLLGTAARLATHALFGIIGGLIEGIGEGIGEALIGNIGRGRSKSIKQKCHAREIVYSHEREEENTS